MPESRRAAGPLALVGLPVGVFVFLSVARCWGIWDHFWMLGDQIRDWRIALGSFADLPLVGPPTHVGGYTIGPAFYWILYGIARVFGPPFDNLPHGGGIGQALLDSAVDALLAVAVYRRTGSLWFAAAAAVLIGTAPYDLALSAVIWNPVMGTVLAKAAMAAVLLRWPERSLVHVGVTAAIAWCAVQAYTGAIFTALAVFVALVLPPMLVRDRRAATARLAVLLTVVVALQVPYVVHRMRTPANTGMGAVTESLARVFSGDAPVRLRESVGALTDALNVVQVQPWRADWIPWLVAVCGLVVFARYRRDPALVAVVILPVVFAVGGYAFWLGDYHAYYYLSVMPAAVLTVLLGVMVPFGGPLRRPAGVVLLAAALAIVPARLSEAATIYTMPEYGSLVRASRLMARRGVPLQRIEVDFLPPTSKPDFLFLLLGGRISRDAEWITAIAPDGTVTYRRAPVR